MPSATQQLPIQQQVAPDSQQGVADAIREAGETSQAVYPLGGETSLDYGLMPTREGIGLSTEGISRVVDYAARDMTITVEAGISMRALDAALATEGQYLPVEVPRSDQATLGGALATNFSGLQRFGQGTLRDYVIGITAVDGRGVTFHGGGRVVKNVAGYDFCKLLTGSLGTLAVITQATLKVRPRPTQAYMMSLPLNRWEDVESALAAVNESKTTPTAVELLAGSAWEQAPYISVGALSLTTLVVRLEGTATEVGWMQDQLASEWFEQGFQDFCTLEESATAELCEALVEFPEQGIGAEAEPSPLVVKVTVPPSAVAAICQLLLQHDPQCTIQAHAGNGVLVARFASFSAADLTGVLMGKLRPAATNLGGNLVVLRSQFEGLTRQIVWGGRLSCFALMEAIKQQFDPHGILNPGRFVY